MDAAAAPPLILIVDDESGFRDSLGILVRTRLGARVVLAASASDAIDRLGRDAPDVVLSDVFMDGGETGLQVLEETRRIWPQVPVVLMSAVASRSAAITAVNQRAFWFLEKPFGSEQLVGVLRQALAARADATGPARRPVLLPTQRRHNQAGSRRASEPVLVASGPVLEQLWGEVAPVLETPDPVLIIGPAGMGKSRLAREIAARRRPPRDGCFIPATTQRASVLTTWARQLATDGAPVSAPLRGSVIIEDLPTLPEDAQAAWRDLLVRPEEGGLRPAAARDCPWWLVTAPLQVADDVALGRLRADLYHALAVHVLRVPAWEALDSATQDALVASLVEDVVAEQPRRALEGLTEGAQQAVRAQRWSGGLRELRHRLVRAADRGVVRATAADLQLLGEP